MKHWGLRVGAVTAGVAVVLTAMAEPPPLFPFVISYDGPDNASSVAHLLDAPAGKHGFVRVENGRFATDAGPIRFHGTNLTGPACFPSADAAEKLAARLARLGFNCVRLHFMDTQYKNFMPKPLPGLLAEDPGTQRLLDPQQFERLDTLIAALKKRGIYVNMNLHVGRTLDARDGFEGFKKMPFGNKGINLVEPRMIALQKEYARQLLTHVNPRTGNAYADEPCVAMIEISNENALDFGYVCGTLDEGKLPERQLADLRRAWNDWLARTYPSPRELREAWGWTPGPDDGDRSTEDRFDVPTVSSSKKAFCKGAARDFMRFLHETEEHFWTGMHRYLKQVLFVRQPVSGTQLRYSPPDIQAKLDYVDIHAYWRHPEGDWMTVGVSNTQWSAGNDAMVATLGKIRSRLAVQRVRYKPYTVSEYNHPYPNQYGAEGRPMLCAYGRLHGWDGVFQYSYNHYADDFEPQANPACFFDSLARTDVLAHYPACAAMFLRGDVRESVGPLAVAVDNKTYSEQLLRSRSSSFGIDGMGLDTRLAALHRVDLDFGGGGLGTNQMPRLPPDQTVFVSDTGEITWNTEKPEAAYLAVNTPNTKVFTGFPAGRTVALGGVSLAIGTTRLNWATVSLVSRHATGFGEKGLPASILLAATGDSGNSGRVIKRLDGDKITLTERGGGPVLAEGIPAEVALPSDPAKTRCYALDPRGDRKGEVPVEKAGGGGSRIRLSPDYKTVWYEIEIR